MTYSSNTFSYSGNTYTLNLTLYSASTAVKKSATVSFDGRDIELFEYSTKLNSFTIDGRVIYRDRYAKVDKFMTQQDIYCTVYFAQHKKEKGTTDGIGAPDPEKTFMHDFLVQSIKPLERNQSIVVYEIVLQSAFIKNLYANIKYSNYMLGNQNVLDIFKNCIAQVGLQFDKDSFSQVQADVEIPYITKANDNLLSISKYLMQKLYTMPQKDTSVKLFFYDIFANNIKMLDLKDKNTVLNTYSTVLSMFKSSTELMIQSEPTNLGAFSDPVTAIQAYIALCNKDIYGYSYASNEFNKTSFSILENMNYVNNRIDGTGYQKKYITSSLLPSLNFFKSSSYWNNSLSIYDNIVAMLEQDAALVLNITGELKRQVGTFTLVSLDRSLANLTNDSKQQLEEEKLKYKMFEGIWFNSKVQNIISFKSNQPSYRQKVALFRNFIPLNST